MAEAAGLPSMGSHRVGHDKRFSSSTAGGGGSMVIQDEGHHEDQICG